MDDEEGENYFFYNGEEELDYKVTYDYESDLAHVVNESGQEAMIPVYQDFEEILWVEDIPLISELDYVMQDLYWNTEFTIFKEQGKIGLFNPRSQWVSLKPIADSIAYEFNDDEELILYNKGQISRMPSCFLFASELTEMIRFYDEMVTCFEKFDYAWDAYDMYVVEENGKQGVLYFNTEYDDSLEKRIYKIDTIIELVVDSFYVYKDDFVIATKGDLKDVIDMYNGEWPPNLDFIYSEIYLDEDEWELVYVPSMEALQTNFPGLLRMELMSAQKGLFRFESRKGQGVYDQVDNKLLLPMEYDSVKLKGNVIEVKRDGRYGYMLPEYYDYAMIGYTQPFFLFEEPLQEGQFARDEEIWTKYQGDSIRLVMKYDEMHILTSEVLQSVADTLTGIEKVADQLKLLHELQESYLLAEKLREMRAIHGINLESVNGNYFIWISATSQRELDSLKKVGGVEEFKAISRIELIRKNQYYPSSYDLGLKANWYSSNYQSFRLIMNNKAIKADGVVLLKDGQIAVYKGSKGKVYDWGGKKICKLKKNEFLLDYGNNYQLVEYWNGKDSIATCIVKNQRGKVIFERERVIDDNQYSTEQDAYFKMLSNSSFVGSNSGNEIPMELITSEHQTFIRLNGWFYQEAPRKNWKKKFYDLNGNKIDADYVLEEDYESDKYGFKVLVKETPRALLYGIHNGEDWVVPMEYDYLEEYNIYDYNHFYGTSPVLNCFKVGIKNVFNLYDLEGHRLLKDNFYHITDGEVIDGEWVSKAILEGSSKEQKVSVEITKLK